MSVLKTVTSNVNSYLKFAASTAFANLCRSGHPFTFAVVAELADNSFNQDLLYAASAFPWTTDVTGGLGIKPSAGVGWSDDSSQILFATSPAIDNTHWYIFVCTNANPGTTGDLNLYAKNITTGGAWQASGALTGQQGQAMGSSGFLSVGNGGNNDFGNGGASWALAAIWAGVALSSTQVQALATNLRTSDWYNNAGGKPDFLVECTSLTPTDIGANPSTYSANSNLSLVADTSGWTYDGQGGGTSSGPFMVYLPRARFRRPPYTGPLWLQRQASYGPLGSTNAQLAVTASDTSLTSDSASAIWIGGGYSTFDTSNTSDSAARNIALPRAAADTTATSDSASRLLAAGRSASDTTATADSASRAAQSFARTAADTTLTSDTATNGSGGGTRSASDTTLTADSATRLLTLGRSTSDSTATSDSAVRTVAFTRTAADTSATSDTAARIAVYHRGPLDTSTVADAAVRMLVLGRAGSDISLTSDSTGNPPQHPDICPPTILTLASASSTLTLACPSSTLDLESPSSTFALESC